MQNFCFEEVDAVLKKLKTGTDGLSEEEAEKRLVSYGKNRIEKTKNAGVIRLFFSQFTDFMTVMLIAAALISGFIALVSPEGGDLTDAIIILFIIFLNAVVGTVQSVRADKAIESLKKLSASSCRVRRSGKERVISCEDVTVGDIVLLEEGDVVPADLRLLEGNAVRCDESALTGESVSVEKSRERIRGNKAALGEMKNTLFGSTYVVGGNCTAVVTAVGMGTEMGKIAEMLQGEKAAQTPLEKSLSKLGKVITCCVLVITAVIFLMGVFVRQDSVLKNFMTAVAIAVAAIPEGLPAVVTIIMAFGVQRMSRKNVIIRKLKSVETLGSCTVICTDKTGTLTQNKLKVSKISGAEGGEPCAAAKKRILQCMAACNTVKGERGNYMGDPTEVALKVCADENGVYGGYARLAELPFSSDRKMMTEAVDADGEKISFTKGAPDFLIEKCAYMLGFSGIRELTERDKADIRRQNDELSDEGLRVLAFAFRAYEGGAAVEEGLVYAGLCGMRDGLKKGVREAVAECRGAGIDTVIITGDHVRTALSVAKKLNVAEDVSQVMTGEELDGLSGRELDDAIAGCKVFARVSPRHKNMIVKSLKRRGHVVAMTGDGVNDAPSIKSADIGIAMGVYGTDVTKGASDMVICDDNFATIVSAVREGRRISANIRKTIQFFISTNLAEVLAIFLASVFFFKYDFLASTQLLWLNLITDSFPVLALGAEREDPDVMNRPPERAERSLFSRSSVSGIAVGGIIITAITTAVFIISLNLYGNATATTMTFITISFAELFHAFNVRNERASAFNGFASNKALIFTVIIAAVVNAVLCLTPLGGMFSLVPVSFLQLIAAMAAALCVIPLFEIYKLVLRAVSKRRRVRANISKPFTNTADM